MKAVVQRVAQASVDVDGVRIAEIGKGLLILVCVEPDDTDKELEWTVGKCARMRIFDDADGVMNLSVTDIGGDVLVVSQFTLAGSVKKGNRPSYIGAAGPDIAIPMYEKFCDMMTAAIGRPVGRGRFGADMKVGLLNDGPVTIIVDTAVFRPHPTKNVNTGAAYF